MKLSIFIPSEKCMEIMILLRQCGAIVII